MTVMKVVALGLLLFLCTFPGLSQEEFYHPELEWRTIETQHFYVHYHPGTERTARVVAKIAEEIYHPITSLYRHEPDQKISFVIKDYDDHSNGAAYFFDNKIEIWASSMDFDLRGTHNWLRNVVTHEFTHIIQIQTTLKFGRRIPAFYLQWLQYESERRTDVLYGFPNGIVSYPVSGFIVPSWFAEGVAQYSRKELGYDSWDSHRDMILRMYALDGNMLSWNEMAVFGKTSLGNESSYNSGFAFVRYIGQRYGDHMLEKISREMAAPTALTIDGAIERATGKDGKELYDEWKAHLKVDYTERTAPVRSNIVAGELFGDVGFANFYPQFSPDGKFIAYVSNKRNDYFSQSSLYLYDISTKKEKRLKSGVRTNFSWAPDGKSIYYSKLSRSNDHWSNLLDLYSYDIENERETRLSRGLRANAPAVSPDGSTIAFVSGSDGTLNLFTMDIDGTNIRRLTHHRNGEQVYNPAWSPDGKTIVFDYSIKDGRDIARIPASGGEIEFLIATDKDERNPVFERGGETVIYTSDRTGIFNLYQYDLRSGKSVQLTNVLGGAFMPSVNADGDITFATYTSTGYKVALFKGRQTITAGADYLPERDDRPSVAMHAADGSDGEVLYDWKRLREYDDAQSPSYTDTTFKNITTSLTFIPFLRVDNYNPKNKGIDVLKLGLYAYSYDVLDRFGFFGGAAINKRGERDLFFIFDYRGKIPGLFQLGFEPALSLEVYNLTRGADNVLSLREDLVIPVNITYNLLEFDVALKQKLLTEALDVELRFAHSRYNASVGSFLVHDTLGGGPPILVQSFGTTYLKGNDLSLTLKLDAIGLSTTTEINPVGRKIKLRYNHEFNNFNPRDTIINGQLVHFYENPNFHRLQLGWREHRVLPGWKHTLSAHLRGGTILGPPVDNFFDFYIGGLAGMKGYPYYSLGGNEFAHLNLTYRFPLLERIDLRILQLYFDKLYAAVYGDVGNVFTTGNLNQYSDDKRWKRDLGLELRLESFSYYAYPTRIFLSATYGFDQFSRFVETTATTATYGKEWNFHFGVLFGFDFD